ncbi:MAG: alpha/beta hydrolase [Anaerolineae bacterium]|nr:alpha/beta hydrolase [Anaerolineae bacterium]
METFTFTYETGDSSRPALVFLHGGGLSSKSWHPVIERLPDFYCLAPDLPGHGQSKDRPLTLEASAQAVIEVIRQKIPGGQAHLVGLSWGGAVILTILRTAPEVATSAILSGSSGRMPRWSVRASLPTLALLRFFKPETLAKLTMKQQGIPDQYDELLHDDLLDSSQAAFMKQLYLGLADLNPPQEVTCPLLVCSGEKDPGVSKWYGAVSLRPLRYASAQSVLMPGAGHAWPLQVPDVFAEMVRAWVTRKPLPVVFKRLK